MKKRNRMLSLLLAAMLAFPAAPLTTGLDNNVPVAVEAAAKKAVITNVKTGQLTIESGETFQLKANRLDGKWKSSNKKAVTVSKNGKIKGIADGTATITLTAGGKKASIEVTVGTKVTNINVIKSALALPIDGQSTIKAEVLPADASNKGIIYQSADETVASVSKDGIVTAKGAGETKITLQASDGSKKKKTVIVTVRTADSPLRLEDDFYQVINASTLGSHPLRENQGIWTQFSGLQDTVTENLSGLIDELVAEKEKYAQGTVQQKIIDFYQLAKDMDTRNRQGIAPLKTYVDQIDQAQTVADFVNVLAQMQKMGINSIITFSIAQDDKNSSQYILKDQGPSYVLPKDYFTESETSLTAQNALRDLIKQMFILAGDSEEQAATATAQVYKLQQEFAENGPAIADRYNVESFYNPYTKEELANLYSNCDIEGFLKINGITSFDKCIVSEVENAKIVNSYLTPEHLDELKNYTKFVLYLNCSNYLTSAHAKALNDFNTAITGSVEEKDADTMAKEFTQALFSWEFGKLYTEKYFSEESKHEVEKMTKQIIDTFRNRLQKIDWLSDTTKQKAIQKLDKMKVKIGYPDKWPSYLDEISIDPSKGLIENLFLIEEALNTDAQKLLDSGVDKEQWGMTPQTVNAMYNPMANDITFPAAILQAPFYDKDADYAQNLGGIGTVIGHEITHAFDTFGSGYDENGNFYNWWTQEDLDQFQAKAQKVKDYYNSMEVENGIFQNGDTTVGENIADIGGMACVLDILGNDKEAQRKAFESNANIWASNLTNEYRTYLLMMDPHSLNKVRVNAVLPLFDQFYEVYGITKNDAMYVAPKDRVQIW